MGEVVRFPIKPAWEQDLDATVPEPPPQEPANDVDAMVGRWWEIKQALKEAKKLAAEEKALRQALFTLFFPAPREGINTRELPAGWKLKGKYKLDRKVDEAALPAVLKEMREKGISCDDLVRYKPELATKEYRNLTETERDLFNTALTIRPALPELEIIPPKTEEK